MKSGFWQMVLLLMLCPALALSDDDSPPPEPFSCGTEGALNDCFCISRDGKLLALNHWAIWDIASRKRLKYGNVRGAHGIAFSPDGKLFATAGNFAELFVFHTKTGKVYWNLTLTGHSDTVVHHVEFTEDGKHMVSSSANGMLRVWDIKKKAALALYCFPSTSEIRNGYKDYLRAWKTIAGNKSPDGVKAFVEFKKKVSYLDQFALHPDSKLIAVPTGSPDLLLLELTTGKVAKTLTTKHVHTCSVAFSRDGKLLAIGGGDDEHDTGKCTIEIWDTAKGKRLVTCKGHRHTALHLAFSPDGKLLASGGTIDGVRVWDVATGKLKYSLHQKTKGESRNLGVAFLPNGKALLTLPHEENAPVHFWEPATGKRIPQAAKAGAKPR